MKTKLSKNYSGEESPYQLFSVDNNIFYSPHKTPKTRFYNKNPHNNIRPSTTTDKYPIRTNHFRPLTAYEKSPSTVSTISKSLKSVTLSSKLYSNYINYYSIITQDHAFKTPKVSRYPILKNQKYLPIGSQSTVEQEPNKENITHSTNKSNPIFLSFMKEKKQVKKKIEEKPYGFKYGETKIRFDRAKSANGFKAGKDFSDLCEQNAFEAKFYKQIGLKNIDIYNSIEENQKNFNFFLDYLKKADELKDIFMENNFWRKIDFNGRTAIKKENMDFKLDIYSLCFKFFPLNNSNNKKECQKLYFPFELIPIFYLLDFTSFKVFLSEIIIYNKNENCFKYIKETILIKKLRRYYNYISNSLSVKPGYINNIIYNMNESHLPLIYDWIVSINHSNEEEDNKKNNNNTTDMEYNCFKLKIVLPKIKFNIDNPRIKISKYLNKQVLANLIRNKFNKWQKFILYDLFTTKKFKIISNLLILNKYYKINEKKIKLDKRFKVQNKIYEFFLTQTGENISHYYTFIPYIILILFGEKTKKAQKICLNLKESKNLIKFGNSWGMMNTLFKCMYLDTMKNKIFFKFDSLEDDNNELYKVVIEENSKNNTLNKKLNIINNLGKKITGKNATIRDKERDNFQTKYKDNNFEISLLNCTLLKINITSNKSENKYYVIPSNILKNIFSIKDENKIFNTNCTDISIMGRCIGENSKAILIAKEADITSQEQEINKKANIKDELYKYESMLNEQMSRQHSGYNKLKTAQLFQNNANFFKKETNKEENLFNQFLNDLNVNSKKKVSISNVNELKKSRIESGERKSQKRRTTKKKNIK